MGLVLPAAVTALLGLSAAKVVQDAAESSPAPAVTRAVHGSGGAGAAATRQPGARGQRADSARRSRPVQLRIAAIGVSSGLQRLRLDGAGQLQTPRDPMTAGWWAGGPVPGDLGAAVLIGHLDSRTGPALFWRLGLLRAGDRVRVSRSDGLVATFVVDQVRRYATNRFPTALVYGPTPDRQLRLITCGGSFDRVRGRYRDNIVVFARAAV